MKQWYTAQELAGLAGMPGTDRAIQIRAKKEAWEGRRREGSKAQEYAFASLPADTQSALLAASLAQAPAVVLPQAETLPAVVAGSVTELASWQRECAEARLAIVREIQRMAGTVGMTRAVMEMVNRAGLGNLPDHLQGLVRVANAKAGEGRTLSRSRLYDWCRLVDQAGSQSPVALLAPKARAQAIPAWASPLLKAWGQPQKPALTDVLDKLRQVLPADQMPSYHQAYRFLTQRMGKVDVQRGRMGSRELKNIKGFIRRDSSMLLPGDVYTADGHCFDAEVAHPMHGQAFRPEITAIIDVASRRLVGWSCDLAESRWAVLDALRCAAVRHGIPAIFYVDNGSGYCNDLMQAEGVGLLARLHTDMRHALPYNSQAKGVIERSHQTLWVKAAQKLPTFIGKSMDGEAKQKVHRLTRKDIAAVGSSRLLPTWSDFVAMAQAVVDEYNNTPHRALPKIHDAQINKRRHMTPNEAWALAERDGFQAEMLAAHEAQDLFRPYTLRTVRRCEIELFNNRYYSRDLEQYHGEQVQVGYEIHDATHVLVRDMEGRLIARADWNANKRDYFPQPVVEQARQQRMEGRLKRLKKQEAEIILEKKPAAVLEHLESVRIPGLDLSRAALERSFAALNAEPAVVAPQPRTLTLAQDSVVSIPETNNALDGQRKYQHWQTVNQQKARGEALTPEEEEFWGWFQATQAFRTWSRFYQDHQDLRQQALA